MNPQQVLDVLEACSAELAFPSQANVTNVDHQSDKQGLFELLHSKGVAEGFSFQIRPENEWRFAPGSKTQAK
jgi:hypothetical protein